MITLLGVAPPVWRRLRVPAAIRLSKLHRAIQTAMGWQDYHLHEFRIGPTFYGNPVAEFLDPNHVILPDSRFSLQKVAPVLPAAFIYEYDFGGSWQHLILVERYAASQGMTSYPVCIAGARACPPEDVSGVSGYAEFPQAIADPRHEDHVQFLAWAGGTFDPERFDRDSVNAALARLR
jgi:hypothetical protein